MYNGQGGLQQQAVSANLAALHVKQWPGPCTLRDEVVQTEQSENTLTITHLLALVQLRLRLRGLGLCRLALLRQLRHLLTAALAAPSSRFDLLLPDVDRLLQLLELCCMLGGRALRCGLQLADAVLQVGFVQRGVGLGAFEV